ncbi:hypothetical protein ABIF78_007078 [Bradyrhizobium japonicum]
MFSEARDDVEREIGALELRIGVDDDGDVDGIRDAAEVGFDLGIGEREVRLQDRQNPVGAEPLVGLRLRHCIRRRGGGDAGHNRHTALRGLDGGLHDRGALRGIEIGELAGRTQRRQPVHACADQIVAKLAEDLGAHRAIGIHGRNEIGKDAVKIGHVRLNPGKLASA